jgi:hypothetical protein
VTTARKDKNDNPYLNHMPNTTPCIPRKYSGHDLNKPAHLRIQVNLLPPVLGVLGVMEEVKRKSSNK